MSNPHPGAEPYAPELRESLALALAGKGSGYEPRTHHLDADGRPTYTNRLILEDSPYLLQHAHNPVDWYPWGEEAFARAKAEGKAIFLSIGYSTCHWCHVMERESFENEEIARLMNQHFVCIKIDRERRPDVDDLYMTAVQLLTGHGGWPMSSFLTPDGKPFFGGTYFPPAQFAALLQNVATAWNEKRGEIEASAERISAAVSEVTAARGATRELGQEVLTRAVRQTLSRFDPHLGGFGRAPKFPHEPELLYLLARSLRHDDHDALDAAASSLDAMARGGIYDQVGGGFHRYSVDAEWLVPHFEKMLYNQAHLSRAYAAGDRLTGNPFFGRIARQTLDYVLREMTSPEGAFYSATDADSEGEEGVFFVWSPDQLREALGEEDAAWVIPIWGVTDGGNFEGHNILHLEKGLWQQAEEQGQEPEAFLARLDALREKLWQVREKREHPLRDDKLLTAWNGMMITALAEVGEILGEPRYVEAAERAADFLWRVHHRDDGQLFRVRLEGSSSVPGLQEDYAYFGEACLSLYDATGDSRWLDRARQLADTLLARFWDAEHGGFFMSGEGMDPHLISRPKSPGDGATPSGNSVAVRLLSGLARRGAGVAYRERAQATVKAFSGRISEQPAGFAYLLMALDELLHGEVGPRQYAADGKVRVEAELGAPDARGARALSLELRIAEGWHVNAAAPIDGDPIATELSLGEDSAGWELGDLTYPPAESVELGFQDEPVSIYQGTVQIRGRLWPTAHAAPRISLPLRLRIQACDDRVCLRPEDLVLELPTVSE